MKRINIYVVMFLFIFGFFANEMFAQRQGNRNFRGQRGGFWTQLNEDQKQEIEEKIKELRDAGASREEVQQAIDGLLESYGIDQSQVSRIRGRFDRFGRGPLAEIMKDLEESQKQAIRDKQKELRESGKTPEEVHAEIGTLLQSFGVELPDNWEEMQSRSRRGAGLRGRGMHLGFGMRGGFSTELSADQKEAVQNKMKELREQDATREEIHAAVGDMLQSFGIELPDNWGERTQFRRGRGPRGGFWQQLNEEQKEELQEMIKSLKDNGATEKEIREALNAKLKEFGIEPPQRRRGNWQNREDEGFNEQFDDIQGLQATNYPNPFNPETNIVYSMKNSEKVLVRIYNTNGQLIRTLLNEDQSAGTHTLIWDGRNDSGLIATSGMYFYRIDAGSNSLTQGMILMK